MRTIVCSSLVIAMFVCSTSCDNLTKKSGTSGEYGDNSAEAASHIIDYTNLIVDLSNKHNTYLENVVKNTDKIEKALKTPNDRFAFMGINKPYLPPTFKRYDVKVTLEEPVKELSKEDQKFFKDSVGKYQALFKSLQGVNDRVLDYITAQDYKDDKGAKGYAMIDTIRAETAQLYALKSVLIKRVEVVADESEKIILKDSPLKDYILAMKEDMKNVRSFINMMDSGAATYATLEPQAKAQYDALEKAQATHSQLNMDNAKKANKEHTYNNFYSQMHDFLLDTRKIMRDAGERGTLTENDLEGLDRYYDYLVGDYNNFNN